jgi:hypothetical protein
MRRLTFVVALGCFLPALEAQHTRTSVPEMQCIGFIRDQAAPLDLYVSGTEQEGLTTFLSARSLVYVSGPAAARAKVGETFKVVRPEGKIRDANTGRPVGIYHKEIGQIRIQVAGRENATGTVLRSCSPIFKGDALVPVTDKATVDYRGPVSTALSQVPEGGLASSILVARDDAREISTGQFCFIGVGARDSVKLGDRFTVYRLHPKFDPNDLVVNKSHSMTSYAPAQTTRYRQEIVQLLTARKLPPRILGDLVVVEVGEGTSAVKVVSSRMEMHVGDLVVRK